MKGMVSGIDVVFETAREGFDVGAILDAVMEIWPEGLFQDAEEDNLRLLSNSLSDERIKSSLEFIVYKDQASADSWVKEGWTEVHANNMAHFLVVEDATRPAMLQLTLVIGSATSETIRLIAAVFDALGQMGAAGPARPERSQRVDWDSELRAAGYEGNREQFYEKVEELSRVLFPEWTADELACHPHESLQFCEIVRRVVAPVPDHLVMKAMMNRRKQPKKGETSVEPRLLWGA
jgi:hypothetical protein